MTAPSPPQPLKRSEASHLQCIFLRDGVAHVSPTATIQELLHSSPTPEEITLQQRIKNSAEGFTDKHKKVMDTIRQEMTSEEGNFDEALHVLEAPTRPQTTSSEMTQKHASKVNAIESQVFLGKKTSTPSIASTKLTYDYMSGVWRMLQSERESEEFMISPKGYEFDEAKTKWVPKSDAVVMQIEDSKQKCEEWLTKKCEVELAAKPPLSRCNSKLKPMLPRIKTKRNKLT